MCTSKIGKPTLPRKVKMPDRCRLVRRAVQVITISTCLPLLAQQPNQAVSKLEGLWGVEQTVGPKVKGELRISRADNPRNELRARIDNGE